MSSRQESKNRGHRRSEAFFGRRKSKALSSKQKERFLRLMPGLCIDTAAAPPDDLAELFSTQPSNIVVEIGFGGGEHLVHQAVTFAETGFIGVEPFVNSMAKALREIDERRLKNIRLYDEDAVEVLDWLPPSSVDRIDLLYPDPWPKMRHWKRRFVSPKNLDRMARTLKPGGEFRFASDIDSYVNWTLLHCEKHADFNWKAETASHWREPYNNWIRTRYEAKAIREGRQPCYLRFTRI